MDIPQHSRDAAPAPAVSRTVIQLKDRFKRARGKQTAETIARGKTAAAEAVIDSALVRRFNGGDEAAFVQIVGRYRERIRTLADRFLRNHADAEEIAQDTFIRAHRALARFRGESSLATWLHHIAVNLARNRYWYFFRRRRHLTLSLDFPLSADAKGTISELIPADAADPARQAAVDEFIVMVAACMEKLDHGHREVLTLRNLLHRSYDEIASTLRINVGTVKSRIARARVKLRELIAEACPEFRADATAADWFEPVRGDAAS